MATVNFYLKNVDKKGESPIMLTYQHKGKKFRHYTRLKIRPNAWNGNRAKINYTGYSEINGLLDDMENILKSILREGLFNKKEYSIELVRRKFLTHLGELNSSNNFFDVFDKFIEDSKVIKKIGTIKNYSSTKISLEEFQNEKKYVLNFETINETFYKKYVSYLLVDLKRLNNTLGKHIKNLKVFLKYAINHNYTNQVYDLKKFKAPNEEADIMYLTENELFRIYNLKNLPERLKRVRDIFCFGCFTGLRFSDIDKLRHFHLNDDFIEIKAEKTKDSLRIPLNVYAKEILGKYQGSFNDRPLPTGLSNQKTNEALKEIGEYAKLNDIVCLEKFNGSNKMTITKKKYELLSTHTARRTFVTLALEKGIRAEVVMIMTGHRNYKTFKRYIKITDKVTQIEMNRVWKKPLLKVV